MTLSSRSWLDMAETGVETAQSPHAEGFAAKGRRAGDASKGQTEEQTHCDKLRAPLELAN